MKEYKMNLNPLALAYIGDAYFELCVRNYLIEQKLVKVNDLNKNAIKYVSANSQARSLEKLLNENILTETELEIVKRARNHKVNHKPKNTDIVTYHHATALEALIGYLYVSEDMERLNKLIEYIIGD